MNNNNSGKLAEFLARMLMRCKGYRIICGNYVTGKGTRAGEIDFIARRGKTIAFVEVKAPNKKPRPLQKARHRLLQKLGFKVYVLDDAEQIGGIIDEIRTT